MSNKYCPTCKKEIDGYVTVGEINYCNLDCAVGIVDGDQDFDLLTKRVIRELITKLEDKNSHEDWYTLVHVVRQKCLTLAHDLDFSHPDEYSTEHLLSLEMQHKLRNTRLAELSAYTAVLVNYDNPAWRQAQMKLPKHR